MENLENTNLENLNLENKEEQKNPKKAKIVSTVLAVIVGLAFLAVTVILTFWIANTLSIADDKARGLSLAFFIVFGLLIVGVIGYIATLILSIVGLVISSVNVKNGLNKGYTIYFIILTALPIIAEATFIIISNLA